MNGIRRGGPEGRNELEIGCKMATLELLGCRIKELLGCRIKELLGCRMKELVGCGIKLLLSCGIKELLSSGSFRLIPLLMYSQKRKQNATTGTRDRPKI